MSLFVVNSDGAVKLRRRKDVVLDSPSCDALSAYRRPGLPVLPKHRALVVGDVITWFRTPNSELTIWIDSIFEVAGKRYWTGHTLVRHAGMFYGREEHTELQRFIGQRWEQ